MDNSDMYKTVKCGAEITLDLKRIEPGSFMMGGSTCPAEKPVHEVTIKEPFYMGVYPVTQMQYEALTGTNPSLYSDRQDSGQHPVNNVGFEDAVRFCTKLSELNGEQIELPSETLWEFCCRAESSKLLRTDTSTLLSTGQHGADLEGTTYCFGDDETQLEHYANYEGTPFSGYKLTTPVGMYKPNAWGLYDMHGNVWEWCKDRWHDYYESAPVDGSAWLDVEEWRKDGVPCDSEGVPVDCSPILDVCEWNTDEWHRDHGGDYSDVSANIKVRFLGRVYRGGCNLDCASKCRSAYRDWNYPFNPLYNLGFRVCLL